jgi:chromosome segregation ATPase
MASRAKQLDEVKPALAALQEEIQETKKKVNRAEERLEKVILEGKSADVRADLKDLYEGAVANLTGLQGKEKELLKRETLLSPRAKQLDEVKPALAALQEEIQEAESYQSRGKVVQGYAGEKISRR